MRLVILVLAMFVWFIPAAAAGQTAAESTDREESGRLSIHVAGGPLISSGSVVSAAFGFSPTSRLRLLLNVERDRLPFESKNIDGGTSITRGGTLTFASGEVRVLILSATRVSPFAMVGAGAGAWRATVNETFPDPLEDDLRVFYFGGGVRIPLRRGFSLWGDVRGSLALTGDDGVTAVWPVRAGLSWRF
jgi:hypothetical protein